MNKTVRDHLTKIAIREGIEPTDDNLGGIVRNADEVWNGNYSYRRWWCDCFTVVSCEGMLLGFNNAATTGDESPWEKGWVFDPNSICEVEKFEETK